MLHHGARQLRLRTARGLANVPLRAFHLTVSDTVQSAIAQGKPTVALESTIITHGLPYPHNLDMAKDVESIIREEGCVPATTAFINGRARVGLDERELEFLSNGKDLVKVSRRDIASVIANKQSGGTTIAGTMILAHKAGIKTFGTGGLGGVHRGVKDTWDISADLEELGRTPVAVFCSGPKSILDIPKTIEYLETKGVHVSTLGPSGTNIPGFFTRDSGVASPFNFSGPSQAAGVINAGLNFGLENGYVFCVPVPEHLALPKDLVDGAVELALAEADAQGISGKAITPFLLKKVWELTDGGTVATNIEFVKNNARLAAQTARELAKYSNDYTVQMPVQLAPALKEDKHLGRKTNDRAKVAVVGALAQDITCTLSTDNISISSYPGQISTSIGGVGHNVALASAYTGTSVRLITEIGEREQSAIVGGLSPALNTSGIKIAAKRSARYVSMNDSKGDLIVACSDMETIEKIDPKYISSELKAADAEIVAFDGNLGEKQMRAVLDAPGFKIFEPTSIPKSALLADQDLRTFPNPTVNMATPNSMELMSMFEEFSYKEKFDLDHWFPIIDGIPLDTALTQYKMQQFIGRSPQALNNIVQSGLVQAAVHLLPYIPNLFVKLGAEGVLSFQLIEHLKDRTADLSGANSVYILNKGKPGVLIQHFPVPEAVPQDQIKSVNGIGDTFCGVMAAQLGHTQAWLRDDGPHKLAAVTRAQKAAGLSLQTFGPVNSDIADLFLDELPSI